MTAGTGASELGAHALIDMRWMLSERPHQHIGNCFLNPCRWLQRTSVRELCLGSWIWKLWLNRLFEEVRPNFPLWNFCCAFCTCIINRPFSVEKKKKELSLKNCSQLPEWSWEKEKAVCLMVRSPGSHCFAKLLMQRLGKWNRVHLDRDVLLHQRQLKARIKVYHPWWVFSFTLMDCFNS